jgi:hypothetical protein
MSSVLLLALAGAATVVVVREDKVVAERCQEHFRDDQACL